MTSINNMLRLSTICVLLAAAVAQNGYEYNKPGKPFGSTTIRPGYPSSGYPSSTPSYPSASQDAYPGSTPYPVGISTGANYPGQGPSGPAGYPGQSGNNYPGQNYPGQISTGPSGPSGYPGQPGSNNPSQNYPGVTVGPNTPGFGPGASGSVPGGPGFAPGNTNFGGAPGFGPVGTGFDSGAYEGGDYSAIPGEPDIDYPILSFAPKTSFRCDAQPYPGYYADVETRCQAFHVCANNITYDFLCPNGTIFSQEVFVCVWWNQFDCNLAQSLYELNANIYDYSITGSQQQVSYPGSQGPTYPGNQDSQASYPGNQSPHGSYPGSQSPSYPSSQGPHGSYPGSQSPSYPSSQSPSYPGPSTPYPDNFGSQGPSSGYPSSSYPQGTTPSYSGIQDASTYPGTRPNIRPQGSSSYPGSSNYPSGPQNNYPSSQGNYPGSQSTPGYPSSQTTSKQGYPSGRPSGPSFPTVTTRPQSPSTGYPQPPNREYLPPRN